VFAQITSTGTANQVRARNRAARASATIRHKTSANSGYAKLCARITTLPMYISGASSAPHPQANIRAGGTPRPSITSPSTANPEATSAAANNASAGYPAAAHTP
jgi:hypothetical protein